MKAHQYTYDVTCSLAVPFGTFKSMATVRVMCSAGMISHKIVSIAKAGCILTHVLQLAKY